VWKSLSTAASHLNESGSTDATEVDRNSIGEVSSRTALGGGEKKNTKQVQGQGIRPCTGLPPTHERLQVWVRLGWLPERITCLSFKTDMTRPRRRSSWCCDLVRDNDY
jgi:hypothetical protein